MVKTLSNAEIINILVGLNKSDIKSKQMPIPFLWALKVNTNKLYEINNLYEEERKNLINKYSSDDKSVESIDENGTVQRVIKDEYKDNWINENNELLGQTTDFDFKTVSIESLNDVTMSPTEFDLLSLFMFDM